MPVIITNHAYDRAKERFKLKSQSLDKLAQRAFDGGTKHGDTKGRLNKYITKLWFEHKTANNVRVYGEYLLIFADSTLITLYHLPNNLRRRKH